MTYEYVHLDLWFKGLLNGKLSTTHIQREARIVNNLKAKLLVGMDIRGPEKIDLLFTSEKMVMNSCKGLVVLITTTSRTGQPVKQNIQTVKKVLIEPHTLSKPEYHSATQWLAEGDRAIYAHVVDSQMTFVQVRNDINEPIVLGRHAHLGYISECLEENCYLVLPEAHALAGKAPSKIHWSSWVRTALTATSILCGITQAAFTGTSTLPHHKDSKSRISSSVVAPAIQSFNQSLETILPNGITTYGQAEISARYSEVINRYPDLWADKGRVAKIPESDWMTILLVDEWDPTKVAAKVYSTTGKDRNKIDKAFDKLHNQGRMEFSNEPTPFAYPVFIVWRTITKEDGSNTRKIDQILQAHRGYVRAYIDNIVVFSKTLEDHLIHLNEVFNLLASLDIVLAPTKTFLGFPSTTLLSQKVDSFGMAAASEKIQAISGLAFPITLQDLEHYLGLTGWMRDYVPYYTQIVEPLQSQKTEMLKSLAKSGAKQKQTARSTRLVDPTEKERALFDCLQAILSKGGFLHHFDSNRRLYINLDSSKRGVSVIVYHVK
ncbi:probable transposable element [Lasallia pustulata]|uniref:Probable transposable element n=1 Tax=Lasallia pustulata TaxID=136370 RepID=A0A1W5CWV4_9LECA|nr:probable transposable element [Lasallia pustulata]